MDLHKAWQALQEEKFSQPKYNKDMILQAIQQESCSTMSLLKKHLFAKLIWIAFFVFCLSVWMLFSLSRPELLIILSVPFTFYFIGLIGVGTKYFKLDTDHDLSGQTLPTMKYHYKIISSAINMESIFGLFFFPVAAIIGVCVGLHYKGVSLAEIFQTPKVLIIMLISIIILTPLGHFAAKKMNDHAFGRLLKKLKNNINQMEDFV